jgi:hypothetical protein
MAALVRVDGGIDQIAAHPSKVRQPATLVCSCEPAVADEIYGRIVAIFPLRPR